MIEQHREHSFRIWGIVLLVLTLVVMGLLFIKLIGSERPSGSGSILGKKKDRIAVIEVTGPIMSSKGTISKIRQLDKTRNIAAVIVRINSPGGGVGPSQEIYEAIKFYREKHKDMKVVVSMGSVAASGGYWIAMACDKIYANAGTMTGSIGVLLELVNLKKLFHWMMVKRETLKAGKYKDVGNMARDMTPEERKLLESLLKEMHQQFRDVVKSARGLTDKDINVLAQGQVFTGKKAKSLKLIDELGGFTKVVEDLKTELNLSERVEIIYPEPPKNFGDYLEHFTQTTIDKVVQTVLGYKGNIGF